MKNIALQSVANFLIIVLPAEIATAFSPKMVAIFARNTRMRKFANFGSLYLLHITTFFNQKLVYNGRHSCLFLLFRQF